MKIIKDKCGGDSTNVENIKTEPETSNNQKVTERGSRTTKMDARSHKAPAAARIDPGARQATSPPRPHLRRPLGLLSELLIDPHFRFSFVSFEYFSVMLYNSTQKEKD